MSRGPIPLELLLSGYAQGAFPMAETADDAEVRWIRPHVRAILPLDPFRVPERLARTIRASPFSVTLDRAFDQVIACCAEAAPGREETWINGAIREAYMGLHAAGLAHSVEVWDGTRLAGGLYGLRMGGAFFGESMFRRATDASKIALVHLAGRLNRAGFGLLDAQFENPHLDQFGARAMPHGDYIRLLNASKALEPDLETFRRSLTGAEAVAYARQPTTQAS
ncbi:leucyl/phenylalanyl-tRNA--protein transferase [Brevundimonas sp.]|jgi:leucyl/phenylalanyl-tRNA--protein transferase|uniref:leucyl/phenylalanyl-tRNA--protein transferase n=1 Tax=Brevundimonas sp. TaxID=1871086 RepID=UPI002E1424A4|nr:leucyl/phenylalanyl-tRNA--protein transferase [Brevundimonas sp.]